MLSVLTKLKTQEAKTIALEFYLKQTIKKQTFKYLLRRLYL
jgi:CHASE2 domain-containing sensor protein